MAFRSRATHMTDSVKFEQPAHDPIASSLSAADDRIVLSEWLPPQKGIVARIRMGRRWVSILWSIPIGVAALVLLIAMHRLIRLWLAHIAHRRCRVCGFAPGAGLSQGGCRALLDSACDGSGPDLVDSLVRGLADRGSPTATTILHRVAQGVVPNHSYGTALDHALSSYGARPQVVVDGSLRPGKDSSGGGNTPRLFRACHRRHLRHRAHRL
jgi:hypothetical protein